MKNIKFVLLLLLFGLSSCAKDIIDLTCSIEGTVKDKDTGMPLANCEIQIAPLNNSVTTASDGTYSFNTLEPGEYTITYNRSGYISDSRTVNVNAGEITKVEMLLKAKASFALSDNMYDYGDLESSKTFVCFNNSANDCSYSISNLPQWIIANKTNGTVKANSNDSFILTIDRSKVGIGKYNQNITIEYSGQMSGTETLLIKMSKVEYTTPNVTTATSASLVGENNFTIEGTITATGGSQITSYGHCWSTTENPTIDDQCTNLGMTDKVGAFKSTIEDLLVNTTYYVRAYATNSQGTAYGEQTIVKTTATEESGPWDGQIASSFAGGSGTAVDPYIIKTGGQLLLMKEYNSKCFKLANDIDLNNNNWLPFEFNGSLDGNGCTIYNLRIARNNDNQGLFSRTFNSTIENLKINGIDLQAPNNSNIGSLIGYAINTNINNCEIIIDKTILGNTNIGGLVGYFENEFHLNNCKVSGINNGNLKGNSSIGGLVGILKYNSFSGFFEANNNHVNIDIEGDRCVGGCYGDNNVSVYINNHSYDGNLKGENNVGGICGRTSEYTYITASKCNVKIEMIGYNNNTFCGGIIGYVNSSPSYNTVVTSCYTTGSIASNGSFGGIMPDFSSIIYHESVDANVINSYTTIKDNINYNDVFTECTSVYETNDVSQTMFEFYSKYAEYWNYKNTWIWNGEVNGEQVSIPCPKLAWEE